MEQYRFDEKGNHVMFHKKTGFWFAYAHSVYKNECYRGRGKTKDEAVQNSIDITRKEI